MLHVAGKERVRCVASTRATRCSAWPGHRAPRELGPWSCFNTGHTVFRVAGGPSGTLPTSFNTGHTMLRVAGEADDGLDVLLLDGASTRATVLRVAGARLRRRADSQRCLGFNTGHTVFRVAGSSPHGTDGQRLLQASTRATRCSVWPVSRLSRSATPPTRPFNTSRTVLRVAGRCSDFRAWPGGWSSFNTGHTVLRVAGRRAHGRLVPASDASTRATRCSVWPVLRAGRKAHEWWLQHGPHGAPCGRVRGDEEDK